MNLVESFLVCADARPHAPAIIAPGGATVTYADLAKASARRARAFAAQGVERGDTVLVAIGVSAALYQTLLALFRLGAVAMFPEPAAGLQGVRAAVSARPPKAIAASPWLGAALKLFVPPLRSVPLLLPVSAPPGPDPLAAAGPDAEALLTFTSGSTGAPKGIVRTAGFLMLQHALLEALRRTSPDDVDLISLPVFILSNLAAGACSVVPAGNLRKPASLDGAALRAQIAAHGVTRVVAPPAVCDRLAEGAASLPLAAIFTGGGPVFPNLLHRLRASAPSAAIHAVYGSTEAEPIAHIDYDSVRADDWSAMGDGAGLLAGRPIPEISVALVDDEIQVAGPHVNRGYLDPGQNAGTKVEREGALWHRTGDAGRLDAEGRLWLLGRRSAGVAGLWPFAVETAALSWPGVRQAALLAAPDARARLAVAGDRLDRAALQPRAARLGDIDLAVVPAIPMDARHNSKVDYPRLKALLS